MSHPRILAFVLAGGQGSRLMPLTAEQAKPALPLTDGCRLIDFVLSNLLLSRVQDVVVLAQYKPDSLLSHVESAWRARFAAIGGRIETRLADEHSAGGGFRGTADAVHQNRSLIADREPDLVGVFAADHVYRMDVRQMVQSHRAHRADLSVAAVQVPIETASSFGIIAVDEAGFILRFEEKPAQPPALPQNPNMAFASMGNYLFEPDVLLELLEGNARRGGKDFGYDILPSLPATVRAHAYDFIDNRIPGLRRCEQRGYWRDVGTVAAFTEAIREITLPAGRFVLNNPRWPILGEFEHGLVVTRPRGSSRARPLSTERV